MGIALEMTEYQASQIAHFFEIPYMYMCVYTYNLCKVSHKFEMQVIEFQHRIW